MPCGEAADATEAMKAVARLKPDIVLVDLTLRHSDGIELIRALRQQFPDIPQLVVSMHEESMHAGLALKAGARGYIMKIEGIENLLVAIRRVLAGKIYLSEEMTSRMIQNRLDGVENDSPVETLSEREMQVFRLIGQWRATGEIARQLHLSVKTIEYHREKIKQKLGLRSAADLTHFSTNWMGRQGERDIPRIG